MLKKGKLINMQICKYASMLALLILVCYSCASEDPIVAQSSAKAITAFSFANPAVTGTIDETTHSISIAFPKKIDLTKLVATFTTTGASVTVGNVPQVSGTTPNDFTKTVTYTVTANDGSKQDYIITPPNSADVLGFTFEDSNNVIWWELPALKVGENTYYNAPADIDFITGFPILPAGAKVTAFSNNEKSDYISAGGVTFTVTAADGKTTKTYNIKILAYNKNTNPYGIYTPEQLWIVSDYLNENFKLMNDITLPAVDGKDYALGANYASQGWQPIGDYDNFMGTLDGNGHEVKNLTIKRGSADVVGLIGHLGSTGIVKNLGLTSVKIDGKGVAGALVGNNLGGQVSHCYSSGTLNSSGNVNLTGHGVGGLVGYNTEDSPGKVAIVKNCYSTVDVTGWDGNNVGGLVGYNSVDCIVKDSYAKGSVLGNYTRGARGSLIGKNASIASNCYATGRTNGKGLIGLNYFYGSAANSYWDMQSTGQSTSDDGNTSKVKRQLI
jgi:hypothetical protein